ncbi:tetraacyldisaccharide 4'-kinase [Amylibacter ulvae]|uniref:Tetraacyldisaccharide 4'-kinase n=1 Tax=Paramylibacter ulvae TaxID=1651968 RepID=A0ABQ3CY63_9RHOB|nr:tetraacyldisaccharide 4'-kinase [Amylibacter ulvae]GHA47082.1 tetraacyldisaccharide 4'-kinase [Amylibacter ulvae]
MRPPRFWYTDTVGLNAMALRPLSMLYQYLSNRRWTGGAHRKVSVPVICVGNINLGGTGKTPTSIYLSMKLNEMGRDVHFVTRGYGGKLQGPIQVDINTHSADDVGDEPLLLAGFGPTWVSKNRGAGVDAAIAAGAECIILDDGMQNPAIAKDLTIMVVDGGVGFGNARIFPAGPLRESVQSGLQKTNFVLVVGDGAVKLPADAPPVLSGALQVLQTGMDWSGMRALAFAGIGRPEKFYNSLRSTGADVVQTRSFGDHQKLPVAILKRLETEAWQLDAQLVTTEKDAARLPSGWQQKILTLPVRMNIADEEPLLAALAALFD